MTETEQKDTPQEAPHRASLLKQAPLTATLLALLVGIYLLSSLPQITQPNRLILALGAFDTQAIVYGQWWRLITGHLLHANLIHLLMNVAVIYNTGYTLEPLIGKRELLFLILLAGAGTDLLSLLAGGAPSIGASGLAYGLLSAELGITLAAMRKTHAQRYKDQLRGMVVLFLLLFINWSPIGTLNIWGHIGGFLAGLLYAAWACFIRFRGQFTFAVPDEESPQNEQVDDPS